MDRKANRTIIQKILLTEWDPIGVSDIPEAQDEYDAYADTVYGMMANQTASVDAVAQYLFEIATEHMGSWALISRTCGALRQGCKSCRGTPVRPLNLHTISARCGNHRMLT